MGHTLTIGTKRDERAINIPRFLALGEEPGQLQWVGPYKVYSWSRWYDGEKNTEVNPMEACPPFVRCAVACALGALDEYSQEGQLKSEEALKRAEEELSFAVRILASALESEDDWKTRVAASHSAAAVVSQLGAVAYKRYPKEMEGCPCCVKDAPAEFVVPKLLELVSSAVDVLRSRMSDPRGSERRAACESLGRFLERRTIVWLVRVQRKATWEETKDNLTCVENRHSSDAKLCAWRNPVECIFSSEERFRCELCQQLRRQPLMSTLRLGVETLLQCLGDPERQVRYATCEALLGIGENYIADLLIDRLRDPDPLVQQSAIMALEMIGNPRATEGLEQVVLEATDSALVWLAERALTKIREKNRGSKDSDLQVVVEPKFDLGWVPERIERSANHHEWAQSLREAIVQGELDALPTAPLDEVEQLLASWRVGDYEAVARETPAVFRRLVELGDEELLYTLWLLYASHWAGVFDEAMAQGNPLLAVRSCVAGEWICYTLGDKECAKFFARRRRKLEETYGVRA